MRIFTSKVLRAPLSTHSGLANMTLSSIQRRWLHFFSEVKQGAVLLGIAELVVRNSETYELKLQELTDARKIQSLVYQINAKESLKSIAELFEKTFAAKDTQVPKVIFSFTAKREGSSPALPHWRHSLIAPSILPVVRPAIRSKSKDSCYRASWMNAGRRLLNS
jgi:hypothetical protein